MSEFTLSEAVVTQTYMYVASLWSRSFFLRWITADPSPWGNFTPPTNNSVERPWGILSLFTTCFWLWVNSLFSEAVVTQTYMYVASLWSRSFFLRWITADPKGRVPLRELHSTDETIVWRDPGGSWACLRPVSDYEWIHPFRGCSDTDIYVCGVFVK